jgi:hypothetical protein
MYTIDNNHHNVLYSDQFNLIPAYEIVCLYIYTIYEMKFVYRGLTRRFSFSICFIRKTDGFDLVYQVL